MEELYSRIAPVWDATLTFSRFKKGLCNYIKRVTKDIEIKDPKILDVGCGTGLLSFSLLKTFPKSSIVATDLNRDMLSQARRLARKSKISTKRLVFVRSDVNSASSIELYSGKTMKLPKESFDVVIASGVLEYASLDLAVPELFNLLKPGGFLIVISVKQNTPTGRLWGKIYHFKPISIKKMKDSLTKHGFEGIDSVPLSVKEFPANLTRVGMVARRPLE